MPTYTETVVNGSSSFTLSFGKKSQSDIAQELGLQLDNQWPARIEIPVALSARLGWVHQYSGVLNQKASFASFSGTEFTVYGSRSPKDAAHLAVEAEAPMADDLMVTAKAQTLLSNSAQSYGGDVALALRW